MNGDSAEMFTDTDVIAQSAYQQQTVFGGRIVSGTHVGGRIEVVAHRDGYPKVASGGPDRYHTPAAAVTKAIDGQLIHGNAER